MKTVILVGLPSLPFPDLQKMEKKWSAENELPQKTEKKRRKFQKNVFRKWKTSEKMGKPKTGKQQILDNWNDTELGRELKLDQIVSSLF